MKKIKKHKHVFEFIAICQHPVLRQIINLRACKCGIEIDKFTNKLL